jgi:DNA-(apurinic or apyrimidinic site) lyase
MTFAVKMFGYAARLVYDEFIPYPMWIKIPVDSRISLIVKHMGIEWNDDVQKYFQSLAEEFGVPPLHLDSLFWIEYWGKMGKK